MRVPLYARPDVSHTGHGGHALSPNHLQQTFKRVVGVSPKTFRDFRRLARLKEHLRRAHSVASASYAAGAGLDPLVVRESL
jgi:methylphosphotriester-DNA--protein-cysteine methyltransferase